MGIASEVERDEDSSRRDLRQQVIDRLDGEGRDDLSAPLERCGEVVWLTCLNCASSRQGETRCKRRYCPVCAHLIAARLVERYESTLGNVKWPLFVTWTALHSPLFPLPGFKPLFEGLKKLRHQNWWQNKVAGGIVSGEVSWGGNDSWHYHLHSILDTRWFSVTVSAPPPFADLQTVKRRGKASQREVVKQWEMAIDRPGSIKAQRCSGKEAVREVLKYAVTPETLLASPVAIGPVIDVIQKSRLVRSFGNMYGHLKDAEQPREKCKCPDCGVAAACVPEDVFRAMTRGGRCAG